MTAALAAPADRLRERAERAVERALWLHDHHVEQLPCCTGLLCPIGRRLVDEMDAAVRRLMIAQGRPVMW